MTNRGVHTTIGVAAGALMVVHQAADQPRNHLMLELTGGLLAAYLGSRLPDIIDPPTSPNHRGIAHGVVMTGGTAWMAWDLLKQSQGWLRARADELAVKQQEGITDAERRHYQLLEALYRIAAGAVMGFVGGYGSHLLLDFGTPKGLPLFKRGF